MSKGLVRIALSLLLMFTGPILLNSSLKNQEHPLFYPVFIVSIIICGFSVILFLKGLLTLVSGLFNDQQK